MTVSPDLAAGIENFNAGLYFQAHELWEAVWRRAEGPAKARLQGLIQAAVALHHHANRNRAGALYLAAKARERLAGGFPDGIAGNAADFVRELERYLDEEPGAAVPRLYPL